MLCTCQLHLIKTEEKNKRVVTLERGGIVRKDKHKRGDFWGARNILFLGAGCTYVSR